MIEVKLKSNITLTLDDSSLDVNDAELGNSTDFILNVDKQPSENSPDVCNLNLKFSENALQKSDPASSLDSNFEMKEAETTSGVLENVLAASPTSSVDSNSSINCMETASMAPKKNCSLPYFHLPNPDLDEFVTETEKNLQIPEINARASGVHQKTFEPKDKGDIVFTVDSDASKTNNKNTGNAARCSDYQEMLSSIYKLDDSKSPGIKRLVLKDYLKKKIEEKKILAFERAKQLAKVDDEVEIENEETVFESESSGEEDIEPTVTFDEEKMEDENSLELSNNLDDDDDDSFGIPKARKVHMLDDDSSDESCLDFADGKSYGGNSDAESSKLKVEDIPKSYSASDSQSSSLKLNNYEDEYAEDIDASGMEITSSITSYQPGGGFNQEEEKDFHTKESNTSLRLQTSNKYLINKESSTSGLDISVSEEAENYSQTFGLSVDDPPISQEEHGSGIFSTQDLRTVCSGIFKGSSHAETKSDTIGELNEGPQEKIQDFFDVEAELSGDDDCVDDDQDIDSEEAENELDLVDDHDLPGEEDLRDEITDLHMKKMKDDDEELLKDLQEKFLDDGELNTENTGRKRQFAWLNSDTADALCKGSRHSSSGSESDDGLDDTWSSMCQEKAKWLQEKEEDDFPDEISSTYKKPHLKLDIIGKPGLVKNTMQSPMHLSCKRPRGSFLNLDEEEATQMLKKIKSSEESHGGSRTTKHFLFRNDDVPMDKAAAAKESAKDLPHKAGPSESVFDDI